MTGECKKLGKPIAVIRKRERRDEGGDVDMEGTDGDGDREGGGEELEIVEVVRFKVVFSVRPEPVSVGGEEA